MTAKAVEILGGMGAFVPKGAKVALLPNVQSKHPGTFTKPEILRSVIRICKAAGASEIACLSLLTQAHWDGAGLAQVVQEEGDRAQAHPPRRGQLQGRAHPGGQALTEARILKELDNYDLYINMPITKDHAGNKFTGTLKNHMGLNGNNRDFHKTNWKTDPADIDHLETCIVDLNTVLKPRLNIVDATEIITSNGPMGPGDLAKPGKIMAGIDRVAIDAYCAKEILGLNPADVVCIRKAFEREAGPDRPGQGPDRDGLGLTPCRDAPRPALGGRALARSFAGLPRRPIEPARRSGRFSPGRRPGSRTGRRAAASSAIEGEDLFVYIDGGAEIYQEYGFRRVIGPGLPQRRREEPSRSRSSK